MAELGRQVAAAGGRCLLVDLYGTGDSAGDFVEADWATWLDTLDAAGDWLGSGVAGRIALLAIRAGALLAVDWLGRRPDGVDRLALWQPVLTGEQWLKQFLRLRVVAEKFDGRDTTVAALRTELARQGALEVAGYRIGESLATALDSARLDAWSPAAGMDVHWLDVGGGARAMPGGAAAGVVNRWRSGGARVEWRAVGDEQFWATQEIVLPSALVDVTRPLLMADR